MKISRRFRFWFPVLAGHFAGVCYFYFIGFMPAPERLSNFLRGLLFKAIDTGNRNEDTFAEIANKAEMLFGTICVLSFFTLLGLVAGISWMLAVRRRGASDQDIPRTTGSPKSFRPRRSALVAALALLLISVEALFTVCGYINALAKSGGGTWPEQVPGIEIESVRKLILFSDPTLNLLMRNNAIALQGVEVLTELTGKPYRGSVFLHRFASSAPMKAQAEDALAAGDSDTAIVTYARWSAMVSYFASPDIAGLCASVRSNSVLLVPSATRWGGLDPSLEMLRKSLPNDADELRYVRQHALAVAEDIYARRTPMPPLWRGYGTTEVDRAVIRFPLFGALLGSTRANTRRHIDAYFSDQIAGLTSNNFTRFSMHIEDMVQLYSGPNYAYPFAIGDDPVAKRAIMAALAERDYESTIEKRIDLDAARLHFAIRRYERANKGMPPQTLDALVTNYIPQIPCDAEYPDHCFRYVMDGTNWVVFLLGKRVAPTSAPSSKMWKISEVMSDDNIAFFSSNGRYQILDPRRVYATRAENEEFRRAMEARRRSRRVGTSTNSAPASNTPAANVR